MWDNLGLTDRDLLTSGVSGRYEVGHCVFQNILEDHLGPMCAQFYEIDVSGVPVEKRSILSTSLEVLCNTTAGRCLFDEIARRLSKLSPPQRMKIILSDKIPPPGSCAYVSEKSELVVRCGINEPEVRKFPFLCQGQDRPEGYAFFFAEYPRSVILGHELGHALQRLETADVLGIPIRSLPETAQIKEACKLRFERLISPLFNKFAELATTHTGILVNGFCPDIEWLEEWFFENMHNLREEIKDLWEAFLFIMTIWNGSPEELPNIMCEKDGHSHSISNSRVTKTSDEILLKQVMEAAERSAAFAQERPRFFRANGDEIPFSSFSNSQALRLSRWGHGIFGENNPKNLSSEDSKKIWKVLVDTFLDSFGIDPASLPIIS
jgi:hypothetical protein